VGQLLAGEARQVMLDDDPLGQGLVHAHVQAAAQLDLADEEEAEALGVHLVVGQETQVLEHVVAPGLSITPGPREQQITHLLGQRPRRAAIPAHAGQEASKPPLR
jgi:hypothetical protein